MKKLVFVIAAGMLVSGCWLDPNPEQQKRLDQEIDDRISVRQRSVELCLSRGTLPIFSNLDGRVIDCKEVPGNASD